MRYLQHFIMNVIQPVYKFSFWIILTLNILIMLHLGLSPSLSLRLPFFIHVHAIHYHLYSFFTSSSEYLFFQGAGTSSTLNFRLPPWTHIGGAKVILNSDTLSLPAPGVKTMLFISANMFDFASIRLYAYKT